MASATRVLEGLGLSLAGLRADLGAEPAETLEQGRHGGGTQVEHGIAVAAEPLELPREVRAACCPHCSGDLAAAGPDRGADVGREPGPRPHDEDDGAQHVEADERRPPAFGAGEGATQGMDGAALGQVIVESYITDDQRIQDDQARAEFAGPARAAGVLPGSPAAAAGPGGGARAPLGGMR